jgi:hypothetical protein
MAPPRPLPVRLAHSCTPQSACARLSVRTTVATRTDTFRGSRSSGRWEQALQGKHLALRRLLCVDLAAVTPTVTAVFDGLPPAPASSSAPGDRRRRERGSFACSRVDRLTYVASRGGTPREPRKLRTE